MDGVREGVGYHQTQPACFTCLAAATAALPLAAFLAACLACTCNSLGS